VGDVGVPALDLAGEPSVGSSRMAFSKTWGRSKAPGGCWCLLGLPCGVCCGLMKASCEGVPGRSMSLARVWSGGGGTGSWKLGALAMVRGRPGGVVWCRLGRSDARTVCCYCGRCGRVAGAAQEQHSTGSKRDSRLD
jgi:hypothetical protein